MGPLKAHGCKKGTRVGVIGLGGLGMIGIKIAKRMGGIVTAISRGDAKRCLALNCGADRFIASTDSDAILKAKASLDLILDTVPAYHDINPLAKLLDKEGKIVLLGITQTYAAAVVTSCFFDGVVVPSIIGGITSTQEVIDLCANASPPILPEIEVRPVEDLNAIYTSLDASNDSGVRYVVDLGSLNESAFDRCVDAPPTIQAPDAPIRKIGSRSVVTELARLTKVNMKAAYSKHVSRTRQGCFCH